MVVQARSNPLRIAMRFVAFFSFSSRIRSNTKTLASTLIPTDKTNPANPASVSGCRNSIMLAKIIAKFKTNAMVAINPEKR